LTFVNKTPLIVASRNDPASYNIAQQLIHNYNFKLDNTKNPELYVHENIRLILVEQIGIYLGVDDVPHDASSLIFASKHVSMTRQPALTVHATGNLGTTAKYGGQPGEVSFVHPAIVKNALNSLRNGLVESNVKMEATMEATHHGPTSFPVPVCFIEIGSSMEQWQNPVLGKITADAIMSSIKSENIVSGTNAVGFGGTHYSDKYTKLNFGTDYSIGHIVPKHAFESGIAENVLQNLFMKTLPECHTAIIDWKGLKSSHRRELIEKIEASGIEIVKI
jgi:D-aminoacyl-tRNA deacylase